MLEAVCPNGHRLQIPPEHAGMKLRCPACNVIFQLAGVPQSSGVGLPQTGGGAPAANAPQPGAAPGAAPADGGRWAAGEGPAPAPAPAATRPAAPPAPAPQPMPAPGPMMGGHRRLDLGQSARTWSLLGLMVGLVVVISARGCDGLAIRNVARLQAQLQLAQNELQDEEFVQSSTHRRTVGDSAVTQTKRDEAQKRLTDIADEFRKKRQENEDGPWRDMIVAARDAAASNNWWGYFREMAFLVGTIFFALGLLGIAFVGVGVERYLSFAMLAIIVFSIFIGGTAWISSMVGAISSIGPAMR